MTINVYPDHKDKHFVIAYTTLIDLHKIGFKLIPLAEDAKTPNVTGLLTAEEEKISIKESDDGAQLLIFTTIQTFDIQCLSYEIHPINI